MQLDARQRAMLLEMGVRVWSPTESQSLSLSLSDANTVGLPTDEQAGRRTMPLGAGAEGASAAPARIEASTPETVSSTRRVPIASAAEPALPSSAPRAPSTAPAPLLPASERAAAIAQMDWTTLQQTVSGCRACRLCESRRHTVFGVGQPQPPVDWMIIGEAPGEREDSSGEPFVGPAGQLLDAMLQAIGLNRANDANDTAPDGQRTKQQTVFISNVLKCRPPGNRNPQADEIAQCMPYLGRQIELLQPRLILALGRFAAQALLGSTVPEAMTLPLGKLRGRPYVYGATGIPVVVSYHPAYLLRSLHDKAKSWADLVLAMHVLRDRPPR